jgi:hypothetical protein
MLKMNFNPLRQTLSAVFSLVLVGAILANAQSQNQTTVQKIDWPEATARLAEMRSRAETCVSLLKRYGKPIQIAQGRLAYSNAKAKIDGTINGLITALVTNGHPSSLPDLQSSLDAGSQGLIEFCDSTSKLVPRVSGQRGPIDEIVKAAIEPLVKAVSSGVAALYNNHRSDSELTRKTIQTQLEAAKWPTVDSVKAAP